MAYVPRGKAIMNVSTEFLTEMLLLEDYNIIEASFDKQNNKIVFIVESYKIPQNDETVYMKTIYRKCNMPYELVEIKIFTKDGKKYE